MMVTNSTDQSKYEKKALRKSIPETRLLDAKPERVPPASQAGGFGDPIVKAVRQNGKHNIMLQGTDPSTRILSSSRMLCRSKYTRVSLKSKRGSGRGM